MLRQVIRTGLVLLSAAALSLCYPSSGLWGLAWIALVPLLIAAEEDAPGPAFLRGYAAGFVFFISTLFWIHHVTSLGLVLLCAYLALYWAVFCAAAAWFSCCGLERRVVFLPLLWAALEYLRSELFSGFGWAGLAHSQTANILFIQAADITGTYGLSAVMVGAGVVMAAGIRCFLRREKPFLGFDIAAWGVALVLVAVLVYGAVRLSFPAPSAKARVALIQANVSLADYADPGLKPGLVAKHLALSREAMKGKPRLIIWPETSFPQFIWEYPELFEQVKAFARENRVKLLVGAVTLTGDDYFNSAILIDEDGAAGRAYHKQHLVLFGEYIPFRAQLPFLEDLVPIDDFTAGKENVLFVSGEGYPFSVLICFEDTVPFLARRAVIDGAGFLVNMTNDAWFGPSRQLRMHLDNAVFRAVENRTALVRATNTGMSCSILPTGAVGACVKARDGRSAMAEGFVLVDVPVRSGPPPFYTKYGDVFAMLCFLGILGVYLPMMRKTEA